MSSGGARQAEPGRRDEAGAAARPARFTTRRRLIAVFSLVLAGLGVSVAILLAGVRRMEGPLDRLEQHEETERVALRLRDALEELHDAARAAPGAPAAASAAVGAARERVGALRASLRERVDDPATALVVARLDAGIEAYVRAVVDGAVPAAARGEARAAEALAASHALLLATGDDRHELLERLHATNSGFRQELVALEGAVLRWTLLLALLAPALVVGAVVHLSRAVAGPLSRIAARAAEIAAGDLDGRIEIDSPDEFGALAGELNAMTAALKQHEERLVESEKLAGIGRLAAGVAHELNNPLQVILGYLSLHRDVRARPLADHLAAMEEEAQRCREIVGSLLELSRRNVEPAAVDLRALCEDVASSLRVALRPREVALAVEGGAVARGDAAKLRRAVLNLARNAVEAAGPDGRVTLTIASRGDVAEVAVRDTGPGVPAALRARLFEPFFTTKDTGTGLGLSVSRAIAVAHGGDIDFANAEPGAVFTLRLPRASAPTPTTPEAPCPARACSS